MWEVVAHHRDAILWQYWLVADEAARGGRFDGDTREWLARVGAVQVFDATRLREDDLAVCRDRRAALPAAGGLHVHARLLGRRPMVGRATGQRKAGPRQVGVLLPSAVGAGS